MFWYLTPIHFWMWGELFIKDICLLSYRYFNFFFFSLNQLDYISSCSPRSQIALLPTLEAPSILKLGPPFTKEIGCPHWSMFQRVGWRGWKKRTMLVIVWKGPVKMGAEVSCLLAAILAQSSLWKQPCALSLNISVIVSPSFAPGWQQEVMPSLPNVNQFRSTAMLHLKTCWI